jgi:hypothetical protein
MFGATKMGGMCMGTPDVCKVPAPPAPPIPTPFPNIGMCATAVQTTTKVFFMNKEVLVAGSQIPSSTGDEAGVAGGVVSGMIKGPVTFKAGSSKVLAEGKAVIVLSAQTGHNGTSPNMPAGLHCAPSQTMIMVAL